MTGQYNISNDNNPRNPLIGLLFFVMIIVMAIVVTFLLGGCKSVETEDSVVHKEKDSVSLVVTDDSVSSVVTSHVGFSVDSAMHTECVCDSVHVSDYIREVTTILVDSSGRELNRWTNVFRDRQTDRSHTAVTADRQSHVAVDSLRSLSDTQVNRLRDLEHTSAVVDSLSHSQTAVKKEARSWQADLVEWGVVILVMLFIWFAFVRKRTS